MAEAEAMASEPVKLGVLTSGGDAPGMNAAIRAVARTSLDLGWEVYGIRYGYRGLLAGDMVVLGSRDVGGIMQQAGTVLGSSRSKEFLSPDGPRRATAVLEQHGLKHLVVIGGNGSQRGAYALSQLGVPVVGIASTIDNDLVGSDETIGTDTALNVALEAIDRLRATADALRRISLVEVMGRQCGYLALMAAIAGGAEAVVIPERPTDPDALISALRDHHARKGHAVVVVAEGADYNARRLSDYIHDRYTDIGFKVRTTILGHVQRGGRPTANDRLLGSRLGVAAVGKLAAGEHGVLVGVIDGDESAIPLRESAARPKGPEPELLDLAHMLSL